MQPGCPPRAPAPTASLDPPVPPSPQGNPSDNGRARRHESIRGVLSLENRYRTSRAGDLDVYAQMIYLKALRAESSRHL
jgi:hypothetical protein